MIRERDPFGRALGALRERLRAGAYAQGEPLAILDLARELDLSATPVREALSRLAGQGLVEDRRGRGYFAWRADAADLAELYALDALHVGAALDGLVREAGAARPGAWADEALQAAIAAPDAATGLADFTEALFARVVRAGGGRMLEACQSALADRLAPARRAEPRVLVGVAEELSALATLFDGGRWADFAAAMDPFAARRRQACPAVAAALRRTSP